MNELAAARKLIEGLQAELAAMKSREGIEGERTALLQEKIQLLQDQAAALKAANEALDRAIGTAEKLLDEYRRRVAKLEDDRAKATRRTIWAMVFAAAAGALIGR